MGCHVHKDNWAMEYDCGATAPTATSQGTVYSYERVAATLACLPLPLYSAVPFSDNARCAILNVQYTFCSRVRLFSVRLSKPKLEHNTHERHENMRDTLSLMSDAVHNAVHNAGNLHT